MNKSQLLVLTIFTTIILFIPIYLIADFDSIGKAIFPFGIFFFFVWPWIVDIWFYINDKRLTSDMSDEPSLKPNNIPAQNNSPIQNTTQPETVIPKKHINSSSKIKPKTNKTTKKSNSEDIDIQEIINCLDFEPFYTPNEKMLIMAEKGDKKTIEELLHDGTDINSNNDKGITALMYASQEGHKDIVELLLQKGADITLKNHEGKTALDIAKDKGFTEIVTLLEKYRPKRRLEL